MRNAVLMFASTLLAVLAALLVYHFVVERPRQDKILAEGEATQRQLEHLTKEQTQIRSALAQTQPANAPEKESLLIRNDFTAASAGMRTAIAEYYMTTMKMPATNAEAGLPAPDDYRGATLKSATIMAAGSIEFVFDANSGVDGGRINMIADVSRAGAMGIQWRCETKDYALIKRALPTCEYKPAQATAKPGTEKAVHAAPTEG
jgi:hypothetical protein